MKIVHWFAEELRTIVAATLYFAACFALIMVLKQLYLAEYGIEFRGLSTALLAALVTAKVVIVLEKVPIGRWLEGQPAIVDVAVRTLAYSIATMILLLVEKAFDARSEHGGFVPTAAAIFEHPDIPQIWAATICVGLSFLAFNAFDVVKREVGMERLKEMFFRRTASVS